MKLDSPIEQAKGVGQAIATKLSMLKVFTVEDLLYLFPRRYEDFSNILPISQIEPGKVTIKAKIEAVSGRYVRRGLHITEATLSDNSGKIKAVWFNQPYRSKHLQTKKQLYFSGSYELQRNRYLLSNPSVEQESEFSISTGRILPIYPSTKGLTSLQIRKILRNLAPFMDGMSETIPHELIKKEALMSIRQTLKQIHFPDSMQQLEEAKYRMGYEELLGAILASQLNKRENNVLKGCHIEFNKKEAKTFTSKLPFTMTDSQKRSTWEVLQDFTQGYPMNRLLQGDVGSGKTVVAAMSSYMAARAGYQTAFMAPTEILAAQHAKTLEKILKVHNIEIALITSSTKTKDKNEIKQRIINNQAQVVVGTHSLIQKDIEFNNLGFIVIDEQHRFGVKQRSELLKKNSHMPHMLSMTATPIPRSLQLTVYGELEVSIIDELPSGRKPVQTQLYSVYERKEVYQKIDQEIEKGRQVYVVCPLVEDTEDSDLKSVEQVTKKLKEETFKHRRVEMLHGQMKSDSKDQIMNSFKNGEIDILVATSVIEVGVDVPNATTILIEGAERFGLAQLHQLRGRVGRSSHQSYCYLMPSSGKRPSERLLELEQSHDGFYLAEVDLRLRGPGEIYGKSQHGQLDFRMADLSDTKLIKLVRSGALDLIDSGVNLLQYKRLYRRIKQYTHLTVLN